MTRAASNSPWILAWQERERELAREASMCEADFRHARTNMEQDHHFALWQRAVQRIISHKSCMPAPIREQREAAQLKAAGVIS